MAYAGVVLRGIAVIIDGLVLLAIGWVVSFITGGSSIHGYELITWPALFSFLCWLAYYIYLEKTKGATLGKMVIGIRVISAGGGPLSWGQSIVRNLLRLVDGFVFYLLGAILIWTSSRNQRLGDLFAGTIVVRR